MNVEIAVFQRFRMHAVDEVYECENYRSIPKRRSGYMGRMRSMRTPAYVKYHRRSRSRPWESTSR